MCFHCPFWIVFSCFSPTQSLSVHSSQSICIVPSLLLWPLEHSWWSTWTVAHCTPSVSWSKASLLSVLFSDRGSWCNIPWVGLHSTLNIMQVSCSCRQSVMWVIAQCRLYLGWNLACSVSSRFVGEERDTQNGVSSSLSRAWEVISSYFKLILFARIQAIQEEKGCDFSDNLATFLCSGSHSFIHNL